MEKKSNFFKLTTFRDDAVLSPVELLIKEIQKNKRSFIKDSPNLSQQKSKKSVINNIKQENFLKYNEYKDPKVRLKYKYISKLLFIIEIENSLFIKKIFRNSKISSIK